jgi:hypothetical protein
MTDWKLPKLVSTISCDYFNLDESSNFYKESTVVYLAHKLSIYTFETLSLSKKEDNNLKIENLLKLPEWGKINYYRDEVEELITESETLLNTMNAMVLI